MRKYRVVQFYRTAEGTKPVAEWLNDLDDDRAQAVAMDIKFFEEYPSLAVPKKLYEKVRGDIWEIKARYGDEQYRLYAFKDDALIIAAVGVHKKWQKARASDLDLADERRKEHFKRKPKVTKSPPTRKIS